MLRRIAIVTLGCPKNQVDSEVMSGLLGRKYVMVDEPEEADIIIVNTCTFIDAAKEESIQTILELAEFKETGRCRLLVATGCMVQRYGEELMREIPELDGVLGTNEILDIDKLIEEAEQVRPAYVRNALPDFIYNESMPRQLSTPKHYAYIKIAEGCDNYCSYCIIPSVRGHFRSRPEESIVNEVRELAAQGVKEIILVAQDTTRYGFDIYRELRLPHLLHKLARIEGIRWIRLMYCYPDLFNDEMIEAMRSEPKVCRYLDLPLQHADEKVLREMNRHGTIGKSEELIHKLRAAMPEIRIRSTMITGFPGETEEEFERLLAFVERMELDRLGAFAYSQEENTPAAKRVDQIPQEVKENRRDRLMAVQQDISLRRQERFIGKTLTVLLEEKLPDGRWLGRTEGDAPEIDGQVYVSVGEHQIQVGDMVQVYIQQADSYDLIGEVVS